ncbi:kinase-like domain-containing protein [Cantharellus anzutake]|uniref:kinase-like domain-containing protein n=1 Tax=Cantharellus anzutake TaxID=1750568 RepID=UPI001907A3FC|nr:kinase-like domain-containing protein [Cantharellus anzutake]KAF8307847.1 kinase-like domain-containing protein [Cantharellus anzutake]
MELQSDVHLAHKRLRDELSLAEIPNLEGQFTLEDTQRMGWGSFGDIYVGNYREIRLKREIRVWRDLIHPNVVALFGWTSKVIRDNISVSLISTWCDGGDVKSYLRRHPTANRQILIKDTCEGLAYLHSKRIIHGDIKPENIVVMEATGVARLCDFGLSSLLDDLSIYAPSSSVAGTLRFISPELFAGGKRNEASDIWAFGCTAGEVRHRMQDRGLSR